MQEHALTRNLKDKAKLLGADLTGVASVDRFEKGPRETNPLYYLPDAASVVVLALQIPRGVIELAGHYREEGKTLGPYMWYGYPVLNWTLSQIAYEVTKFLDSKGYKAIPFPPTGLMYKYVEKADFSHRHAAVAAGLGEFGWNRLVLTPEFGARQRFVSIITNAPLAPDPLYRGSKLCKPELCRRACVRFCPTGALFGKESCEIGGAVYEYSRVHPVKCRWAAYHEKGFLRTRIPMPEEPTVNDLLRLVAGKVDLADMELSRQTFVPSCGACLFLCPAPKFDNSRLEYLRKKQASLK
jgi:epoxyqueuosine reductase QueG